MGDAIGGIPEEEIRLRLMSEHDQTEYGANLLIEALRETSAPVQKQFGMWFAEGAPLTYEVEGWNAEGLIEAGISRNPVGALIFLHRLETKPRAKRRLVRRGYDTLVKRKRTD